MSWGGGGQACNSQFIHIIDTHKHNHPQAYK